MMMTIPTIDSVMPDVTACDTSLSWGAAVLPVAEMAWNGTRSEVPDGMVDAEALNGMANAEVSAKVAADVDAAVSMMRQWIVETAERNETSVVMPVSDAIVATEVTPVVCEPQQRDAVVVVAEPKVETSVVLEVPSAETSVSIEMPVAADVPVAAKESVAADVPVAVKTPVAADVPVAVKESVVTDVPLVIEETIVPNTQVEAVVPNVANVPNVAMTGVSAESKMVELQPAETTVVQVPVEKSVMPTIQVATEQVVEAPVVQEVATSVTAEATEQVTTPSVAQYVEPVPEQVTLPVTEPIAAEKVSAENVQSVILPEAKVLDVPSVTQGVVAEAKPESVVVTDEPKVVDAPKVAKEVSETSESAKVTVEDSVVTEAALAATVAQSGIVAQAMPVVATSETSAVTEVAPIAHVTEAKAIPSEILVETAQVVADTLIVTPGLMRGEGQVTVQLKSDVLDGAQVTVSVTGKTLEVAFMSDSTAVAALLERNLPQLQEHLSSNIHMFRVGVTLRKMKV